MSAWANRIHPENHEMMESNASLIAFAAVATISPGGATFLVAASGAQFGFRRSIPLLAGVTSGVASVMAASAAGLGVFTAAVPSLQLLLRVLGSSYLLWLAWTIASSQPPTPEGRDGERPIGFIAGFALLLVNPKVWTMAVGAGSAYSGLAAGPLQLAFIFGTVFGVAAIISLSLWCTGGAALGKFIRTKSQWRAVNITLGALLTMAILPMWLT